MFYYSIFQSEQRNFINGKNVRSFSVTFVQNSFHPRILTFTWERFTFLRKNRQKSWVWNVISVIKSFNIHLGCGFTKSMLTDNTRRWREKRRDRSFVNTVVRPWSQPAFSSITCWLASKVKSHFRVRSVTNHIFTVTCFRGTSSSHTHPRPRNNSFPVPIVTNVMLSKFCMISTEELLMERWLKCFTAHNVVNPSCENTYWRDTSEKLTW